MERTIVLNDKLHHGLWTEGLKAKTFDVYYRDIMKSNLYKDLLQLGVNQGRYYDLLKAIYSLTHKSMAELMREHHIRNVDLSNRLCVPVRTVENWKGGHRECPDYVKYMTVLMFRLPYLPDGFELEPGIQAPVTETKAKDTKKMRRGYNGSDLGRILKEQAPRSSILERTDYLGDLIRSRKMANKKEAP